MYVSASAQIPLPSWLNDLLSQSNYENMVRDWKDIATEDAEAAVSIEFMRNAINQRVSSYSLDGSPLKDVRPDVLYFIGTTSRNYIRDKYPIVAFSQLYSSQSMFKNAAIQLRFGLKFDDEYDNVSDYLGIIKRGAPDYLRMPEGERMMLSLDALQNIITLTLENEEY